MILSAFYVKLNEKKDEIPPEACRPPKQITKGQKTNAPRNGPAASPSARAGVPGVAGPREETKGGCERSNGAGERKRLYELERTIPGKNKKTSTSV